MLSFDYLLSVGSDTNHRDMTVAEFFKSFNVLLASLGQFIETAASGNIIIKALECFVNRSTICEFFKSCGEILYNSTVGLLISNTNLEVAYAAECIKLIDSKR